MQRAGGVFLIWDEIAKLWRFATDFSSWKATNWQSQTKELSRRLGKGLEGSGGWKRASAQGWPRAPRCAPQHLSSSFEACKLPSVASGSWDRWVCNSWGSSGQEGWKWDGEPSPRCLSSAGWCEPVGNIWRPCGIWQQSLLLWHFLWWKEDQSNSLPSSCSALLGGNSIIRLPAQALRQGATTQSPKLTSPAPGKLPLPSFTLSYFFYYWEKENSLHRLV